MKLLLFRANVLKSSSGPFERKPANNPLINKLMLSDLQAEVLEQ